MKRLIVLPRILMAKQAAAQTYPANIIRGINPAAPGGNSDLLLRTLAPKMTEGLGQQLVMDCRPGAGATVGTGRLLRSAPDGYITMIAAGSHVMNPAIMKTLPYDTVKDFTPLALIADILSVLVTYPSLPAKPVKDLIAPGRAHPGAINFSSGRRGTVGRVVGALFGAMTKTRYTFVAHKGSHRALMDVVADHVQFQFASIPNLLPYVHSGKLNMLAQTGDFRSPSALQYPTMQESGLPGFVLRSPFSFLAPANLLRTITDKLNATIIAALRDCATRRLLIARGAAPVTQQMNTPH